MQLESMEERFEDLRQLPRTNVVKHFESNESKRIVQLCYLVLLLFVASLPLPIASALGIFCDHSWLFMLDPIWACLPAYAESCNMLRGWSSFFLNQTQKLNGRESDQKQSTRHAALSCQVLFDKYHDFPTSASTSQMSISGFLRPVRRSRREHRTTYVVACPAGLFKGRSPRNFSEHTACGS